MIRTVCSVVLLGLLLAVPAVAQPLTDDETLEHVLDYVESERLRLGIPGMAIAIVQGDDAILLEGLGEASADIPMTPDTPFLINSISKSITAVAISQLVEAGDLTLETDVTDVIPELAPGGSGVTIEDLLHHSSGLPYYEAARTLDSSMDTLETTVLRLEPLFGRVDEFEYTNGAYDTLALVVQRVSGIPFEDYIADHVFDPVGMVGSVVGRSGADLDGAAVGHYEWLILGPRPAGGLEGPGEELGGQIMYSTARDLAAYVGAHMAGSLGPDEILYRGAVVSPDAAVEYAGGLWWEPPWEGPLGDFADHPTSWHDGASPSFRSLISFTHDIDVGIVILANWNEDVGEEWIGPMSYNIRRIMSGMEPEEVHLPLDPFIRWSKWITLGIVVAQIALVAAVAPAVRRRRRGEVVGVGGWVLVGLASLVDLVSVVFLVWVPPNVVGVPLAEILELPDFGLLGRVMVVALGWAIVRTGLLLWRPAGTAS